MAAPGDTDTATLGFEETYHSLHESLVGRVTERDVVLVEGPDAASYLQGQCSQDLDGMAPGEGRRSLVLSPQGKLVALVRVVLLAPERFAVEVDAGYGETLAERLRRFKLRVKADLSQVRWRCAEVRGPVALGLEPPSLSGVEAVVRSDDRFARGLDLLGPSAELPAGVPGGDPAAFEALRIEAGVPAMASELDEGVIPQEAGIVAETVSFTKGCFTGQELVARLDARGNRVPRLLRGVVVVGVGPDRLPIVGSELETGERAVGALTSVGFSPRLGGAVGLAYVRREVAPPAALSLAVELADGSVEQCHAEVRELPM
jgi:folate-binding protein YgfZ